MNTSTKPSALESTPSLKSKSGSVAATPVNIAVVCSVVPRAGISSFGAKRSASPIPRVRATRSLPMISPKESSGIRSIAELTPTKRFGREAAKDTTKNSTTNSFQPKKRAVRVSPLTINPPAICNTYAETRNIPICRIQSINYFWRALSTRARNASAEFGLSIF